MLVLSLVAMTFVLLSLRISSKCSLALSIQLILPFPNPPTSPPIVYLIVEIIYNGPQCNSHPPHLPLPSSFPCSAPSAFPSGCSDAAVQPSQPAPASNPATRLCSPSRRRHTECDGADWNRLRLFPPLYGWMSEVSVLPAAVGLFLLAG